MRRGYVGIGIFEPKFADNTAMLWRSAHLLGAQFVFTIGARYKRKSADTSNATNHIPLFHYKDWDDFLAHRPEHPDGIPLIGIELTDASESLEAFKHPERAMYLLGGEDRTLPPAICEACDHLLKFGSDYCLNVAMAGTVTLYDRHLKAQQKVHAKSA